MTIDAFRGRWTKLGNYSSCVVFYDGHAYQSVESAYQSQKSTDPAIQKMIRNCATPALAKKLARSVVLRSDWEQIKYGVMLKLLREKFSQEPERSILLSTGNHELIEGNWWCDQYWGDCTCSKHKDIPGQNMLGKLLQKVRKELLIVNRLAWSDPQYDTETNDGDRRVDGLPCGKNDWIIPHLCGKCDQLYTPVEGHTCDQKLAAIIVGINQAKKATESTDISEQIILLETAIMSLNQALDMAKTNHFNPSAL